MDRLLRINDVSDMTGIPVATLRYWRHQGTGPKAAKLGRRLVWREEDVRAWLDAQFADGRGDVIGEATA